MWLADPKGMFLSLPDRFRHGHPWRLAVHATVIVGLCVAAVTWIHRPGLASFIVLFARLVHEDLAPPFGQ